MSHPKYTGCIQLETRQSKPQLTNIQQITNRRWENTAPSGHPIQHPGVKPVGFIVLEFCWSQVFQSS